MGKNGLARSFESDSRPDQKPMFYLVIYLFILPYDFKW